MSLVLHGCGGQAPASPTALTPAPAPAPSPVPAPEPAPPPTPSLPATAVLVRVSVSPATVNSPQTATGTVTLSDPAPGAGAGVALSSSSSVARTPASVLVAAGAASASFTITTVRVLQTQDALISASYNGVLINTTLHVVGGPSAIASFGVTSETRGAEACAIKNSGGSFDCALDGSSSQSPTPIRTWNWAASMWGRTIMHSSTQPQSTPPGSCGFEAMPGAEPLHDGGNNPYVPMTISLSVQNDAKETSDVVSRTVRVYPNGFCGFPF